MEDLVRKAINGDADSFVLLIEHNMQSMYKTAWVYLKNDNDVADAIQDTILACYEKINMLRNEKYFKTWLTRILINKCTDILRKKMNYSDIENIVEEGRSDLHFQQCEWKELLNSLDQKYSVVILMYYFDGFSVKEISEILHVKKNTVLTRLRRARHLLKKTYALSEIMQA